MAPFSKPETVLKQAEGLVSVGQSHAALQSLTEMFSSKRFRSTPLTSLEPIMLRFVELCVDMRKGRTAKEGLMQYKNIAQNTSVASIETVIKRFVALADAKVQEAQEKAEKAVALVDVDDLEASETPESILLGAVSGDQNKDRTDRALVTPWLKFLWESYRTALETLKNNARLEGIYQQIAQQAFKFCLKHQRKVEFRRLCETLRLHLANVAKYSHQPHSINLGDADTLQHHLDTRFAQLNTSVELELWQEAFRSVEDIHNLLNMAKKAPKPAMMANYYEKLTRIFLTSGNAMFHAAAWARYYGVVRAVGGKNEDELSRLAGQVLISALAVPVGHASEEDEARGRTARLTALLGLTKTPTRTGLLKEALSRNVLKLAPQVVKDLYEILEVTFDPLSLCSDVVPLLKALSSDASYAPYLPLLQRALLSRLLAQLAQVYSTMEIPQLLKLVEPLQGSFEGAYEPNQVEAFLIGCARNGDLRIRLDHSEGTLTFIDEAFGSSNTGAGPSATSGTGLDKSVQPSAHDLVRTRVSSVATCLYNALLSISPPSPEQSAAESQEKLAQLVAAVNAERKALQVRRAIVARRRELISELSVRKEKEEVSRRAEASRREKDEAARRALEDMRKKQEEMLRRNKENFDKEEARKLAQELKEKNILKVDVDELGELNRDNLVRLQVQQIEKEKKDQSERLRIIAKRLDHLERAFRKEERPLLAKDYEQQQIDDRKAFEEAQKSRLEAARLAHQQDLDTKRRLTRMMDDYKSRKDVYIAKRGEEFAKKRAEATRKIQEEKEKRRQAVLKAREEERKREEEEERILHEKEEEEKRLEEERLAEEIRRAEEEAATKAEEERLKREEEERKAELRRQREEERRAAEEKARLQRQREEEAEAKLRARRAAGATPLAGAAATGARGESPAGAWRRSTPVQPPSRQAAATPPLEAQTPAAGTVPKYIPGTLRGRGGASGGGWRERERAKHEVTSGGGTSARTRTPERPASPAVAGKDLNEKKDEEGFQTVHKAWRPSRGRGGDAHTPARADSGRW
ncbi:TIF32 [Sanghuangporus vaninii]